MHAEESQSSGLKSLATVGILLAVIGAAWLLVIAAQESSPKIQVGQAERAAPQQPSVAAPVAPSANTPEPARAAEPTTTEPANTVEPSSVATEVAAPAPAIDLASLQLQVLIDSDLGTGSNEFSAVALNEDLNRLIIADDAGLLFEFDLDQDGLLVMPLRRTIEVETGAGDIEGISWISGREYVIAHEDDGVLTIVEIDDDMTSITDANVLRSVDSTIREGDGNGLEGVAVVPVGTSALEFVVVDERPPTMLGIDSSGAVSFALSPDFDLADFSDIYASPNGRYLIVSDEGRAIVEFVIDGERAVEQSRLDLVIQTGRFEQPEGIARSRDGTRLYVVGEAPGSNRYSFGFWSAG